MVYTKKWIRYQEGVVFTRFQAQYYALLACENKNKIEMEI